MLAPKTQPSPVQKLAAVVALCFASACSDSTTTLPQASLTVINQSDFAIVEFYITQVDNPDYGPNLLAGDVLLPGEELYLPLRCDLYDVLLVDEDGVDCELFDIDLCLNDATFVIRNETCTVFEANAKKAHAARSRAN